MLGSYPPPRTQVAFPILCFGDSDAELWEEVGAGALVEVVRYDCDVRVGREVVE